MESSSHALRAPIKLKNDIIDLEVEFFGFDNKMHTGVVQVHKSIEKDMKDLFAYMCKIKFPIQSATPLSEFNYSDDDSMNANNSSCFNFRTVALDSFKVSLHGYGIAIDINPMQNPYINGEQVLPPEAHYDTAKPGTLYLTHPVVEFLRNRGFVWGGDWKRSYKDYHHFHKELSPDMVKKYAHDVNQALLDSGN